MRQTPTPYELEFVEDGDCDADGMGGTVSWGTGESVFSGCIIGDIDKQTGEFEFVAENVTEQDAKFIVTACNSYRGLVEALRKMVAEFAPANPQDEERYTPDCLQAVEMAREALADVYTSVIAKEVSNGN